MNILVVDDKPAVQDVLSSLLVQLGCGVDTAANGLDAFEKAQQKDYQLYIIDHLMPLMNGVQLTKNLKQTPSCADVPIVFMTTQDINTVKELAEYPLFASVIAKPIEKQAFLDALALVDIANTSFEQYLVNQ